MILKDGLAIKSQTIIDLALDSPASLMCLGYSKSTQLNIKDQCSIHRKCPWITLRPISQIRRDTELSLAADLHARNTFVPPLNYLAGTQHKLERMSGTN